MEDSSFDDSAIVIMFFYWSATDNIGICLDIKQRIKLEIVVGIGDVGEDVALMIWLNGGITAEVSEGCHY